MVKNEDRTCTCHEEIEVCAPNLSLDHPTYAQLLTYFGKLGQESQTLCRAIAFACGLSTSETERRDNLCNLQLKTGCMHGTIIKPIQISALSVGSWDLCPQLSIGPHSSLFVQCLKDPCFLLALNYIHIILQAYYHSI